jgi:hypothetical protein
MSVAEKDINTALSVRLKQIQVADVPPIAWENAPYTPCGKYAIPTRNIYPKHKKSGWAGKCEYR